MDVPGPDGFDPSRLPAGRPKRFGSGSLPAEHDRHSPAGNETVQPWEIRRLRSPERCRRSHRDVRNRVCRQHPEKSAAKRLIRMTYAEITGDRLLALLEALANPHRLLIVSILSRERKYVSQLARELDMSRPLLYMHLKKMEKAGIVKSTLELSDDGKAMKYYELVPFDLPLNQEMIAKAAESLTIKPKGSGS